MPTYQYKCECGHEAEDFKTLSKRDEPMSCPKCGKKMDRLLGAGSGVVFKGSGFYETDYKRKGK